MVPAVEGHGNAQQRFDEGTGSEDTHSDGADAQLLVSVDARSFPPDDRLYRAAFKAQAGMSELVMTVESRGMLCR
jgi:hypothetical protein